MKNILWINNDADIVIMYRITDELFNKINDSRFGFEGLHDRCGEYYENSKDVNDNEDYTLANQYYDELVDSKSIPLNYDAITQELD